MYALLGVTLGLAAFLVVASLVSLPLAAACSRRGPTLSPEDAGGQARSLLALRLLPSGAALVFVIVFYAPAYLILEPRDTGERVSPALALLALITCAVVARGLARAATAWAKTRQLAAQWTHRGRHLNLSGIPFPAFGITHDFPVVAVLGLLRPQLFVAEQVLATLTAEELAAVVAHEVGHLKSGDNLKSLLLRCCPDPLALLPAGDLLYRAWAAAAEAAADEFAARPGPPRALALAAALVKVSRLVTSPPHHLSLPATALHDGTGVAQRVERLLGAPAGVRSPSPNPRGAWTLAPLLALVACSPAVLRVVHALTEAALRLLR